MTALLDFCGIDLVFSKEAFERHSQHNLIDDNDILALPILCVSDEKRWKK